MGKLNIVERTFLLVAFNFVFQFGYGISLLLIVEKQDIPDNTKVVWTITLATSLALSALINILFAWLFSKGLQKGLFVLHDNIKSLCIRQELPSPLEGNDEIAQIDSDIHRLASYLTLRKT